MTSSVEGYFTNATKHNKRLEYIPKNLKTEASRDCSMCDLGQKFIFTCFKVMRGRMGVKE